MSLASLDLFTKSAPDPILLGPEDVVKAEAQPPLDSGDFGLMARMGYRSARAQMPDWVAIREREMTEDAIERAFKLTGKRLANPFLATQYEETQELRRRALRGEDIRDAEVSTQQQRRAKFAAELATLRKDHPDLPDPATFRDAAAEELRKRLRELQAAQRTSTGLGDIGALVGSMGADIQHPINLLALPLGAPAALWAPARAGIVAALGQVAKVGGVEALIAVGAQIPIGLEKMERLPGLGVAYGWPEFGEEIAGAAGMGFLLGGSMRGLVGLWRGVRDWRARDPGGGALDPVPAGTRLAADDGVTVAERLLMDAEAKPARMDGTAHVEALGRAYREAAAGRPADVSDILTAERARIAGAPENTPAARAGDGAEARGEPSPGETAPAVPEALLARPYAVPEGDVRAPLQGRGAKLSTVREALDEAAPAWGELRAAVARGETDAAMEQTANLAAGVRLLADARKAGVSLGEIAAERAAPVEAQLFAALLARDPLADKVAPAGKAAIAARLKAFAEEARMVAPGSEFAHPAAPVAILDRVVGLQREVARRIEAEAKDAPSPEALHAVTVADAKARLAERDVLLPVGVDDEGKTIWKSGRALIEEAEQGEKVAATILECAVGSAL